MFKRKKENRIELKFNITNRNELDELLETIQKDIAALKDDFDKLEKFKLTFDLE
ncbi:cell division septum initiation protein DivIVA [Staphylococcus hominis]